MARAFFVGVVVGFWVSACALIAWHNHNAGAQLVEHSVLQDVRRHAVPEGSSKKPSQHQVKLALHQPECDSDSSDIDCGIHTIMSTGCTKFQHWQSELVLFSHWKSGQKGKITRLVSGCHIGKDGETQSGGLGGISNTGGGALDGTVPIDMLNRSTHPNFDLHVTPTFEEAASFSWFNKPLSIQHFLKHAKRAKKGTIILLDPDMPILHPITQHPLEPEELLFDKSFHKGPKPGMNVALRKRPVGAQYMLRSTWLTAYNRDDICGKGSPCATISAYNAEQLYSVGPPLIALVEDWEDLITLWFPYMKKVVSKSPEDIINDMWAYCMASSNLEMPHMQLRNLMVSDPSGANPAVSEEAWPWIVGEEWSCDNPLAVPLGGKPRRLPNVAHIAHRYEATDSEGDGWLFHKGASITTS